MCLNQEIDFPHVVTETEDVPSRDVNRLITYSPCNASSPRHATKRNVLRTRARLGCCAGPLGMGGARGADCSIEGCCPIGQQLAAVMRNLLFSYKNDRECCHGQKFSQQSTPRIDLSFTLAAFSSTFGMGHVYTTKLSYNILALRCRYHFHCSCFSAQLDFFDWLGIPIMEQGMG